MTRYPRRTALSLGGAALAAALAGCNGGGGSTDPDADPDAGTDSYGITARNTRDDGEHTVEIVAQPVGGDPVFEETATVEPGASRSWDEVLTEPRQTQVKARLPDAEAHFDGRFTRASNYVNVGGENAPAVTDVVVELYAEDADGQLDDPMTGVRVLVGRSTSGE